MSLQFPSHSLAPTRPFPVFISHSKGLNSLDMSLQYQGAGESRTTFQVFSGKHGDAQKKDGRLPRGKWFIVPYINKPAIVRRKILENDVLKKPDIARRQKQYWFALFRDDTQDGKGGDRYIDNVTRVGLEPRTDVRVHFGSLSLGCLTFRKIAEYSAFVNILSEAKARFVHRRTGQVFQEKRPGSIEVVGVIEVR